MNKPMKVNAALYRDYDLLSNNYKEFDKEKKKVDYEIAQLNAATNYWKKNDFDIIKGEFMDNNKEVVYQQKRDVNAKNHAKELNPIMTDKIRGYKARNNH